MSRTELAWGETQNRLRKLTEVVEHAPAAIVITGADGTIEYVNAGFEGPFTTSPAAGGARF
jgi:PAS domain-containing protein